jgi:nitrogen fixation NifU-like protein
MAYSEKVIDHYENPRNVGSFEKGDESVGTGMVGAPACGDVMKLQIKVNPETGVIEDARFKTYGCGSAIASSSLVTEWVKGKTLDQAAALKNSEIAQELALPPVKIHCSILAEDAIKAAVEDPVHRLVDKLVLRVRDRKDALHAEEVLSLLLEQRSSPLLHELDVNVAWLRDREARDRGVVLMLTLRVQKLRVHLQPALQVEAADT